MVQGSSNGAGTSSNIIKPSLQLKWADKKQVSTPRVKSLAEIQQEEAEKERKVLFNNVILTVSTFTCQLLGFIVIS